MMMICTMRKSIVDQLAGHVSDGFVIKVVIIVIRVGRVIHVLIVWWRSSKRSVRASRRVVLGSMFSTNNAYESRAIIGKMTSFSAVKAGGVAHVIRIGVRLAVDRFWRWRGQVDDRLQGWCLGHLGRGGCKVVSVR